MGCLQEPDWKAVKYKAAQHDAEETCGICSGTVGVVCHSMKKGGEQMKTAEQVSAKDLQGVDIFAGLSDDSLEQLAKFCNRRVYEAGEYCAAQGETMGQLLIVNGGSVTIEMQIEVASQAHTVTIAVLTKGRVCGCSAALAPPNTLTASIKCVERAQVISIRASDLQRICEERPSLGYTVMKNLATIVSSRLRESRTQLERLVAEVIKQGE